MQAISAVLESPEQLAPEAVPSVVGPFGANDASDISVLSGDNVGGSVEPKDFGDSKLDYPITTGWLLRFALHTPSTQSVIEFAFLFGFGLSAASALSVGNRI